MIPMPDELIRLASQRVEETEGQCRIPRLPGHVDAVAVADATDVLAVREAWIGKRLNILARDRECIQQTPIPGATGQEDAGPVRPEGNTVVVRDRRVPDPARGDEIRV